MRVLSWPLFRSECNRLAFEIRASEYQPNLLVAVARGGWIPTRFLSDSLGVKRITSVGLAYKNDGEVETYSLPFPVRPSDRVLLIEDMLVTGTSITLAAAILGLCTEHVRTAALYYGPQSNLHPDYSLARVTDRIVFPWEEGA